MNPLRIVDIGAHVPASRQTVAEAARELALPAMEGRLFERFYGLSSLPYEAGGSLWSLHQPAVAALAARHPELGRSLDLIVFTHTLPAITPLHGGRLAARLAAMLDCRAEVMDLSLGHCATALAALPLLAARLKPGRQALLLAGERGFHPQLRVLPATTIMGEAACAVLLQPDAGGFLVEGVHARHDGRFCRNSGHRREADGPAFAAHYPTLLVAHLRDSLQRFGLTVDQLKLVLPHNVNAPSWQAALRQLGWPQDKLYLDNIARYGHCFGADPFLNLRHALAEGRLARGDRALLVAVGMGATLASALVRLI